MKQKHAFCIIAKVFVKIIFRFVAKDACEIKQIRFSRQREKGVLFCFQHYLLDKSSSDDGANAVYERNQSLD
jgi:hypothetical protein